jgi:hypothetical protein
MLVPNTKGKMQPIHRKEVNLMSNKGKHVLAALAGAAVGGSIVALSTRALPNLMSGMMAKCKRMMAGMSERDWGAGDMCKQITEKEQAPEQAACHSEGASCHGSD